MKQKFLFKTMLLLCALVAGSGSVWAEPVDILSWTARKSSSGNDTYTTGFTYSTNKITGKNGYVQDSGTKNSDIISIALYRSTKIVSSTPSSITFTAKLGGGATRDPLTYDVYVCYVDKDGNDIENTAVSVTKKITSTAGSTFTVPMSTAKATDAYGVKIYHMKEDSWNVRYYSFSLSYEETGGSSTPSISADNVSIGYNETSGSLTFTIDNAVDGGAVTSAVVTSSTPSGWLTVNGSNPYTSPISLSCEANATAASKTATVHLTYTYNTDESVEKDVTVTQAGNPNVVDNIEDISAASTQYTVKGTVVATNSRGFVIGDGTGYVYTYLNSAPSQSVDDIVKIAGTTGTYGQIIQFTNSATITTESTSTYDGTPAATVITAVPDYSTGLHLSTYLQFEGELEESSSNYYITVGSDQIQISYPTTAQSTALSALDGKTVRVKGYFSGINSSSKFTVMLESVEEVTIPTLSVDPATAGAFTYVVGSGPSDDQMFTITGTNLVSADITATVSSDYEITDNTDYSNSVTIASGDIVSVRLKEGLAKGTHNGTLTLSSTDATDVVINLSGSVTGQTYAIEQYSDPAIAHGTITFSPTSPIEDGTEVTLSAEPAEGYTFTADSWVFYKESGSDYVVDNSITVTDGKIIMPAYELFVDATFTAKQIYAVTCVADPAAGGELISDPDNAYEGQVVTLSYSENSGYSLSSIVITKTSDGSATGITPAASGDDYTFTMPGYAVTVTATFNEVYSGEGTFIKYESAITEGYYVITYNSNALNNTISSNRFTNGSFTATNDIITNPDGSIVWYIKQDGNYWTLYNEAVSKYAAGTNTKNQGALIDNVTDMAKWTVTVDEGVFQFENLGRSNASSDSGNKWLRNNGASGWACYASATGGALTLYKLSTITPRTITFDGNGGTYDDKTTYTQTVNDGVATALTENQFTRSGYEFSTWNTEENGSGDSYDNEVKITVTGGNLTLYAQWAPLYTLTIDNAIDGGSVAVVGNITSAIEGTEITLTNTPTAGYTFSAWNVYKEGDTDTKVSVIDNKFNMPAYNVVISATFAEAQTYSLITDASNIVSGKHYIIASGTNGDVKAMGEQTNNNRSAVDVTATSGIIPETTGVYEFVIYGPDANGYYTIYDEANSKYLYAASSSSNYLKTRDTNTDANGKWTIVIDNTGIATIKAKGDNTRNWMRNNGNIFSCYGSGQSDIYLYVKDGESTPTESVTITSAGYATYASDNALDFSSSSIKAYIASASGTTGVTFTKVSKVPANMGVLLYYDGGKTESIPTVTGAASPVSDNVFKRGEGTAVASVDPDNSNLHNYILNNGTSGIGFYRANDKKVAKNRAYIQIDESKVYVKEFISLPGFDDDDATGIRTIDNGQLTIDNEIYNLAGQRLNKMQKGINIVNGKKVLK